MGHIARHEMRLAAAEGYRGGLFSAGLYVGSQCTFASIGSQKQDNRTSMPMESARMK